MPFLAFLKQDLDMPEKRQRMPEFLSQVLGQICSEKSCLSRFVRCHVNKPVRRPVSSDNRLLIISCPGTELSKVLGHALREAFVPDT